MPLRLRKVQYETKRLSVSLDLSFEDGTMIGLTGPNGSGQSAILRLIAGGLKPDSGSIQGFGTAKLAEESLVSANPAEVRKAIDSSIQERPDVLLVGPCFSLADAAYQRDALSRFRELQRAGSIVVLASQDLFFLERYCDEVMVLEDGRVTDRGDPRQVLAAYRDRIIDRRQEAPGGSKVSPSSRHGNSKAKVLAVEMQHSDGEPATVVRSGEAVSVYVRIAFLEPVENPVVGILIRNRIGVTVYGTNTELEQVVIGPCAAGDLVDLRFLFDCSLCAEQYTLTVASHDPDGTAHDWLEEAIVFDVADTRYTAGVANFRARIEVSR